MLLRNELSYPYFLRGGGEMGALVREFDWAHTSLGPIEAWKESLKTMVGVILHSDFPMFLWWGDEMIQLYNDAYRPSLGENGKHPFALGQAAQDCWPEIWGTIYPLIQQVKNGESFFSEDQLIPIFRNGHIEDVYWTFSYSPVYDESGTIAAVLVTCTETTAKVQVYNQLKESKDQLQFAIESAELGTWDYNPITNKFTGNLRLREWLGLPEEAELDISLAIGAIAENDRDRVVSAIETALQFSSGGNYDIEYVIINPLTKIERVVRAKGRAWFNSENVAIRFNGTLQDITTLVSARHEIEKIVEERTYLLNKSNADLTQFAYIASHDLQEPARKISTFTDMLLRRLGDNLDDQSKEYIKKIDNSSDRMLKLIRGVLTISKLSDTGNQFEEVNLNIVLRDAKNDYEVLLKEKNCKIESDHLPTIQAIPVQMNQLFSNLISNALKFSAYRSAPCIRITCEELPKDELFGIPDIELSRTYYKISFTDNGIGFEQENATKIFDIFQRLHGKAEFPGTGIGLATCKKIAENHHGHIYARSALGSGATFVVILPVRIL